MKALRRALFLGFGVLAAGVLAMALVAVFFAYQSPTHVVQWLSLWQLCK